MEQTIEGKYEDTDPATGEENYKFSGDLTFTAGPKINLDLPDWLGGGFHGSFMEFDVHGEVTKDYLQVSGSLEVLGGLIEGDASVELNWTRKYLQAHSHFDFLDGLITTQTDLLAKWDKQFEIYIFGEATVGIPRFIPIIGGAQLASGEVFFQYTDDGNYSNDYVAAWANHWLFGTVGIQVSFDGNWNFIGHDEAQEIAAHAKTVLENIDLDSVGDEIEAPQVPLGKYVEGTDDDETLHGGEGKDTIEGKGGNDSLFGEGGDDTLYGGTGDDLLHGDDGDDLLRGDDGDDFLYGDAGDDNLYGGVGDDYLDGNDGKDKSLDGG